jgi:hypothetical protein
MRKQFVRCDSNAEAERVCPWVALMVKVDGGWMCFESIADADVFIEQL